MTKKEKIKEKFDIWLTNQVKDDALMRMKNRLFDEGLTRADLSDEEYEVLLNDAINQAKKDYLKKGAFTSLLAGVGMGFGIFGA